MIDNSCPKKLMFFLPSLSGGGTERAMLTLANGFADKGFDVDLVLASASGPYIKDISKKIQLIDLDQPRVFACIPKLVAYLRKERPRYLVSALYYVNVVAIIAKLLSRVDCKMVVSERNTVSEMLEYDSAASRLLMPSLMRMFYPKANVITAVSHGVARDLADLLGIDRNRITVIYNPVYSEELIELSNAPLKNNWIDELDAPLIVAVGRFSQEKQFAMLIDAFAGLRKNFNARLAILGDGELRADLERQIELLGLQEHVSLPGFIDNPFPWIKRAQLFVLTSRTEGLPGVLIQAMACGTPVVSTDCASGPREILEDGKWGKLVPVDDHEALQQAMKDSLLFASHPKVQQRAADFDVTQSLQGYISVLEL
ncbi:MAG: glycosyltransferase [Pseudomonadota bacterium]